MLWGTEAHLRELFGDGIASLEVDRAHFNFRFASAEEFVAFFRRWYGPTVKAFAALEGDARERARATTSSRSHAGTTGSAPARDALPATYTEAVAITR